MIKQENIKRIMNQKKLTMFIVLLTVSLFNVSCKKSNGGGFIDSIVDGGNGKATIGYQIKCDNILHSSGEYVGHVTGNVQFNDHPAGIKVHADIDFIPFESDPTLTSCEVLAASIDAGNPSPPLILSTVVGTYGNHSGQAGDLALAVITENPFCPTGDGFIIELTGDIIYQNGGCLNGGNLTIF
jgi:hypothetical protein